MLELQEAGFPLNKNDLTLEQWKYIADLKAALKEHSINEARKK